MKYRVYNLGSLNLKVSPFLQGDGELIRCVNFEKDQVGCLKKRPGYTTYLGTADGSAVTDLFTWQKDDGTTFFNYRNSGGTLYYSEQGTAAWTEMGSGDLTAGDHVGHAVLEDTLIIGQNAGTTRHSSDGTSLTDTTGAPAVEHFASKFNRIWAWGTSSDLYYCTQGTPSDWVSDSSSIKVPGPGKGNALYVCNDRIVAPKNSGMMFTYDDYNLREVPTDLGPTSPYSIAQREGYYFSICRLGVTGYGGDRPELLSNAVEKQFYNDSGSAVAGTAFDGAPGVVYKYDYLLALGTTTDDLTEETVGNCIMKYDYQLDEWSNYKFANFPTTWTTFKDEDGNDQLIFGDSTGQCYQYGGTATSDNGAAIEAIAEGVIHFGAPEQDKLFKKLRAFASPGCQAKVQVAAGDSFRRDKLKWMDIGDLKTGATEFHFPDSRGKLLFWKLYEYSTNAPFTFYGFTVYYDLVKDE